MHRDRVEDRLVDGELEARRQDDRPQHPDRVLQEADLRIADAPDEACVEIVQAADVVDDRERADVVEQRVDGEVAPERIFLGCAVGIVAVNQAIVALAPMLGCRLRRVRPFLGVLASRLQRLEGFGCLGVSRFGLRSDGVHVPPERRDFDGLDAELDVREAEAAADDPAVAKELLDLVRVRRRPDVEVLGPAVQQQVADASADQVRDVAVFVEPVENLERVGIDISAGDRMDDAGRSSAPPSYESIASALRELRLTL